MSMLSRVPICHRRRGKGLRLDPCLKSIAPDKTGNLFYHIPCKAVLPYVRMNVFKLILQRAFLFFHPCRKVFSQPQSKLTRKPHFLQYPVMDVVEPLNGGDRKSV